MRRLRVTVVASCALALTGCVTAPVNADRDAFVSAPTRNAIPTGTLGVPSPSLLLLDVRLDRQVAGNGCGAHAVASLADYWHRLAPSPAFPAPAIGTEIYNRTPPREASGYTLAEMVDLLGAQGLYALVVTSTTDALRSELRAGRPAIVRVTLPANHLRPLRLFPDQPMLLARIETFAFGLSSRLFGMERLDHYWLVTGHDADRMIVLDPAMGVRAVSLEAFETVFAAGGHLAVVSGGWKQDAA